MIDILDRLAHSHRFPFFLLFVAFLLTFVITRSITRLIRAGRGPFHNNINGGVHIHHAVPGLILATTGSFLSIAVRGTSPWIEIAAILIGVGTSLVLDEFALIVHMQDVYWSQEGQLSVQVVALTTAALGLGLIGINPLTDQTGFQPAHIALIVALPLHLAALLACVRKGKFSTAVVGAFLPPVGWVGALRRARPKSHWARKHYDDAKQQRATQRATEFDKTFGRWGLDAADLVAGKPTS